MVLAQRTTSRPPTQRWSSLPLASREFTAAAESERLCGCLKLKAQTQKPELLNEASGVKIHHDRTITRSYRHLALSARGDCHIAARSKLGSNGDYRQEFYRCNSCKSAPADPSSELPINERLQRNLLQRRDEPLLTSHNASGAGPQLAPPGGIKRRYHGGRSSHDGRRWGNAGFWSIASRDRSRQQLPQLGIPSMTVKCLRSTIR
ncbi:hypothetical protein PRIC1_006263 [Phytophthora ramorum]|uniref:uncharacterized protein n=1 Tax=Phytophthora ramorum TaxID=164328 RepID=UPI0030AFC050|nr:hypothetical protein KRP23_14395 [Phytophthora ramorum]